MRKTRALIFAEAVTLAHVVRAYQIAKSLHRRGHDVHFGVADRFRFVFDEPGITMHWITSKLGETFLDKVETGKKLYQAKELILYADEEIALIDQVKPDWVMGDFRHSLSISAHLSGVPYINLINAYWSPGYVNGRLPVPELRQFPISRLPIAPALMPVLTPIIFKAQGQPLNAARRHFGLEPFDHCLNGWAGGDRTIFCDVPQGFEGFRPAEHEHFIGHVTWEPQTEEKATGQWLETMAYHPHIYVALGSSGGQGIRDRVVAQLSDAGYPLCVSGVAPNERPRDWPDTVLSAPLVAGSAVAAAAALVVTNGGSPTSYQALNVGTPVVGVPANMDQVLCINHIQSLNAGRMVRPWEIGKTRFLSIVNDLMRGVCVAEAKLWEQWSQGTDFESELDRVIQSLPNQNERTPQYSPAQLVTL